MRSDKSQFTSNLTTRQKVTAGIFVVVVIIVLWQIIGLFRGEKSAPPPAAMQGSVPMQAMAPQPTELTKPKPKVMSQREIESCQTETARHGLELVPRGDKQIKSISEECKHFKLETNGVTAIVEI